MTRLDNCPFCGGNVIFRRASEFSSQNEVGFYFDIVCTDCGIKHPKQGAVSVKLEDNGTLRYVKDDRLIFASQWNTRADNNEEYHFTKEEILKELWNCRNELCLKCERYKEARNGVCNICRYNFENMEKWKEKENE